MTKSLRCGSIYMSVHMYVHVSVHRWAHPWNWPGAGTGFPVGSKTCVSYTTSPRGGATSDGLVSYLPVLRWTFNELSQNDSCPRAGTIAARRVIWEETVLGDVKPAFAKKKKEDLAFRATHPCSKNKRCVPQ